MKIEKVENISVDQIADYLKKYVVVYPTDTVYGLGCSANNPASVEKIRRIKGNDANKPYIVLIARWEMLHRISDISDWQLDWLKNNWPGQITAILPAKDSLEKSETIAVRWPNNEWLEKIILSLNSPIISTSCNIGGQNVLNSVKSLRDYFVNEKPDIVIDGGELYGEPSEIFDLTDEKIKKIR